MGTSVCCLEVHGRLTSAAAGQRESSGGPAPACSMEASIGIGGTVVSQPCRHRQCMQWYAAACLWQRSPCARVPRGETADEPHKGPSGGGGNGGVWSRSSGKARDAAYAHRQER